MTEETNQTPTPQAEAPKYICPHPSCGKSSISAGGLRAHVHFYHNKDWNGMIPPKEPPRDRDRSNPKPAILLGEYALKTDAARKKWGSNLRQDTKTSVEQLDVIDQLCRAYQTPKGIQVAAALREHPEWKKALHGLNRNTIYSMVYRWRLKQKTAAKNGAHKAKAIAPVPTKPKPKPQPKPEKPVPQQTVAVRFCPHCGEDIGQISYAISMVKQMKRGADE